MTIKNNDDVTHLLDATGRTGTPYREFESSADQMSAPLIDAIFGKDAPIPEREEVPLGISQAPGHDLLADVFGTPAQPAQPAALAVDRGGWRDAAPRVQPVAAIRAPAPVSAGPVRSLSDIRRIITQPAEQAAKPPANDSLNGLFDRLAR